MDLWTMFRDAASQYGLPFALFLGLLVYLLYKNDQREQRYLSVIDNYTSVIDKLGDSFIELENDVEQIKNKLWS